MRSLAHYDRPSVGELLRWWRVRRGFSQMELAHRAGVSPRHMSFVETGRSRPGREVLVRIAEALDLPFRETNVLLEAAGHARRYRESTLGDDEMERLRDMLRFVLERYDPYGAVVVDAGWRLLMANRAYRRLSERILGVTAGEGDPLAKSPARGPEASEKPGLGDRPNLLWELFRPGGFHERLLNWPEVAHHLLHRLRRQVAENPTRAALMSLLQRLEARDLPPEPAVRPPDLPVLPMHFLVEGVELRLVSLVTTFGAPQDVAAQELRLEAFLPGDDATDRALRTLQEGSLPPR